MPPSEAELVLGWLCAAAGFNVTVGVVVGYLVAAILGRPTTPAMGLGLVAGPIGWILIGFLEPEAVGACPECQAGLTSDQATRCRHCGCMLPSQAHQS